MIITASSGGNLSFSDQPFIVYCLSDSVLSLRESEAGVYIIFGPTIIVYVSDERSRLLLHETLIVLQGNTTKSG